MSRVADLVVHHRYVVRAALLLLSIVAVVGSTRLTIDDLPRSFFKSEDPDFARLEQVFATFGSDDGECLVLLEAPDVFASAALEELVRLDTELSQVDGVADVVSLRDIVTWQPGELPRPLLPAASADGPARAAVRARALAHPLVHDLLVSPDARATLLVLRLDEHVQAVSAIRPVVEAVERVLDSCRAPDVRLGLTGVPPIRRLIFDAIDREQKIFASLGAALGFVIGLVVFRRVGAILITSAASILAGIWALGLFGLAGEPVNILNAGLPLLIMVIALTDAVHLMIDILRRRSEGETRERAAWGALQRLALPCALTSFTTAVGFGSMAVSRIDVVQRFGILFAGAIGLSLLVVLSVVPTLSLLGRRDETPDDRVVTHGRTVRALEPVARWVVEHAKTVSSLGIVVTLVLLSLGVRLQPENHITEATPDAADAVAVLRRAENAFGGVLSTGVHCTWDPETLREDEVRSAIAGVTRQLETHPFLHGVVSVTRLLELLPADATGAAEDALLRAVPSAALSRLWQPERGSAMIWMRVPDAKTAVARSHYAEIERQLATSASGVRFALTGTDFVARKSVNLMIVDFARGLILAAVLILAALSLAFRSWRLGLASLLPNLFPLVVPAALLWVLDRDLQMTSVIAFTVCLGIAVDDTIHFIARFRSELAACGDPREAAVRSFLVVGKALVITTAILLGGFGVLLGSEIPTTRSFGWISCVGLVSALVGDLLFLPALLVLASGRHAES